MAWDQFTPGYKVNPITGELDTYGYTPEAAPGLKAENGWAQQIPPEILAKLKSGADQVFDPTSGMTYHVAQGQGGAGPQYVFAEDGHTGPGRQYPQYDLAGNYMGAGTGAGNTSIAVPLAAALAMATFGGSLAASGGLGGAEAGAGAAGAGAAGGSGAFLGEGALSGIPAWDAAAGSGALGGTAAGATGAMGAGAGGGSGAFLGEGAASGIPAWDAAAGSGALGSTAAGAAGTMGASGGSGIGNALSGYQGYLQYGAPLVSGILSSNAAKDAARIQSQATDRAIALNEPFRQGGLQGMNALLTAYGLQPGDNSGWAMKDFTPSDLTTDPSYQWRLQQGQQVVDRSAAAHGLLGSGKYLKDLTNYAQGAASQEYGNAFNRYMQNRTAKTNNLQSLAGVGQTANNATSNLITGQGNANAAGAVGSANAWSNALGQGMSMYQNNELMNRLFSRG